MTTEKLDGVIAENSATPRNAPIEFSPSRRPQVSSRRAVWIVFFVFAVLFAATASYDRLPSVDSATNALSAHSWAVTGSPYLREYREVIAVSNPGEVTWFVESPNGPVAQYPPGSALLAVPLQLLSHADLMVDYDLERLGRPDLEILRPVSWPSSLTAAMVSAAALALLYSVLEGYGMTLRTSLASTFVVGLGSAVWTVAADSLWQHGPAILMIALAMRGAQRDKGALVGIAAIGAALIRPPVLILVLSVAAGASIERRDRNTAVRAVAGALGGLAALSVYDWFVFGRLSVSSGYETFITDNLLAPDLGGLARTLWDVLFSADRGVVTYSPFVAVAVVGIPLVWSKVPLSMRIPLFGAAVYVVVQYVSMQGTPFRYTGGSGFSYYRYPIEALFTCVPAGALGFRRLFASDLHWNRWLAALSVGFAVAVHGLAAVGFG